MIFSTPRLSLLLAASVFTVVGCNIFNPGGGTTVDTNNPDATIEYAQKLYRNAEYAEAASYFAQAIAKDSTKSEAYFGLAKAGMRAAGANPMEVLKLATSSQQGALPFMNETMSLQNVYYRSMMAVDTALTPLVLRDTLTELWEYATAIDKDPAFANTLSDSVRAGVTRFRTTYQQGSAYTYGANHVSFPLSDRKYKYSRFQVDYTLARFSVMILGILDFNGDGSINEQDIPLKLSKDSNGNLTVDASQVIDAAMSSPKVAASFNDNIDKLATNSGNLTGMIASMGSQLGLTDSSSSQLDAETKTKIDSQLTDLGDAARFYKIGDHKDNDGDGCIDEEVFDSIDNDMDGFIDEDLRLVLPTSAPGADGVDNNGDGVIDDASEYWQGTPPAKGVNGKPLPFTSSFVLDSAGVANSTSEYSSHDRALKLTVVRDTNGTDWPLERRKRVIGGCWVFYNETSFQQYLVNQKTK